VVDDPYLYGQIAAANALSDIYAMGGKPLLALNIVCFPTCLPAETLAEILRGGADKVIEAGAIIAGGHSVQDNEPKYGLAVAGLIKPDQILSNAGAKAGDLLILTKPLGTGIILTGARGGLITLEDHNRALALMAELNKEACAAMLKVKAHACTDITGFGLLGHASELARASKVSLKINFSKVPLLSRVKELILDGIIPGGAYENKRHLEEEISFKENIKPEEQMILFDPQTSGGLLIAVEAAKSRNLLDELKQQIGRAHV